MRREAARRTGRSVVVAGLVVAAIPLHGQVKRQETGSTAEFRGLYAASARVVWASGRNGAYARTGDGGATWRADTLPGATGLFLVDVHVFGAGEACVLATSFDGGLARIYHTGDDGATWQTAYEDTRPEVFFDGMAFWDESTGVAFGDPVDGVFVIVRSTDGCRSWSRVPVGALPPPLEGEAGFAASGTALAVAGDSAGWIGTGGGAAARVLRSADRGATWTAHETPLRGGPTAGIFGVAFRDRLHGVAVGGDYQQRTAESPNVLRTDDGGVTWRLVSASAPAGVRYGVSYVPGMAVPTLVATGPSGFGVSHDEGSTWVALDTVSVNTVAAAGPRAVWVGGVDGRIWKILLEQ